MEIKKKLFESILKKIDEVGIKGLNKEERSYYDELMYIGLEVDWDLVENYGIIIDELAKGYYSRKPNVDPMARNKTELTKFGYTVIMEYLCFEMELVPEKYAILLEMYEDLYKRRDQCEIDGHISISDQVFSCITPYTLKNF